MKIIIVYPYIANKRPEFDPDARRFFETLNQFNPGERFEVAAVACNVSHPFINLGADLPVIPTRGTYLGGGFDIGTHIWAANSFDCDMMVGCTSKVYFHREGWLSAIVQAWNKFGNSMYAPMGSYEIRPHLRTCCFACDPIFLRNYPQTVNTKDESFRFESGEYSFMRFVEDQTGRAARMVACDGVYQQSDWRTPNNIFRRGDQSNVLVYDRHTRIYEVANAQEKAMWEGRANGTA